MATVRIVDHHCQKEACMRQALLYDANVWYSWRLFTSTTFLSAGSVQNIRQWTTANKQWLMYCVSAHSVLVPHFSVSSLAFLVGFLYLRELFVLQTLIMLSRITGIIQDWFFCQTEKQFLLSFSQSNSVISSCTVDHATSHIEKHLWCVYKL